MANLGHDHILEQIYNLIFNLLSASIGLHFHVAKGEPRSFSKEATLEDLVEVCCSQDLWGILS